MNNSGEKWSFVSYRWGLQNKAVNINPIALRFRPIAPKPVTGESDSRGGQFGNKNLLLCKPRAKRKYVTVRKNNIKRNKRSSSSPPPIPLDHDHRRTSNKTEKIVTLQLLPEKTEAKGVINDESSAFLEENNQDLPCLFNSNLKSRSEESDRTDLVSQTERETVVESWVTVECVTDTCMVGRELGNTDVEKMKNLEEDTCPGFISDGFNRVQWVNRAYERMLTVGKGPKEWLPPVSPPEIKVWLVIKKDLPNFCTAFSCKVRLQFTWLNKSSTIMLPCDVWKMDGPSGGHGGFAWRLDIEAALSLGLSR
ncbi:Cytochrome C1 family isoform 1 [Hibiscus syriacus]|uniref:Cytochrome C1 family isoform 1 n=1 Tax=Hibiscus syriacus TaxID=106335 RepID=A0A6A2XWV9_HIBSY|nr:Cytochrome C1 family isoform 1 [Hibiscus syriacus]